MATQAQSTFAFTHAHKPKHQVRLNETATLDVIFYAESVKQTIQSGTITIRKPGGEVVVDGAAISIVAGSGAYQLASSVADEYGSNWTAHWELTSGIGQHTCLQMFDVVRYPLQNPVEQTQLVRHHEDLADVLFSGQSDYSKQIELAFEDVYYMLESKGRRPNLVLSSEDLKRPIEHLSLHKIFLSRFKEEGDRWWLLADYHLKQYHAWAQSMNFVYDEDNSGTVDGVSEFDSISGEEGAGASIRWRI